MTKLTDTQTIILSAGAQRPDTSAMTLPKGLAGVAAKLALNWMIDRGWLQEVEANLRVGGPLWGETGDGHDTKLVVTDAGLLAIGIEPVVIQTKSANHNEAAETPEPPTQREGTKQAMLIAMLQAPTAATMEEIVAGDWLAGAQRPWCHVRGAGQEARADCDLGEARAGAGVPDRAASALKRLDGRSDQQTRMNLGR